MRLLLLALGLGAVAALDGKSIVDPVLKHDAKQCGQYLCPGFPNAAEVRAPILALSRARGKRAPRPRARALIASFARRNTSSTAAKVTSKTPW